MLLVLTSIDNNVRRKGGQMQVTCSVSRHRQLKRAAHKDPTPPRMQGPRGKVPLPADADAKPKQPAGCWTGSKPAGARVERARRHSIPQHHNKTKTTPHARRITWVTLSIIAPACTIWSNRNYTPRPGRIDATRHSPGIGLTSHNHNSS